MKNILNNNRLGFTLMELIVSIAIVSMMLFLVNRIFFDTSEAVSRGIATSKIISNTRTIGEQIANDAERMLGPKSSPAGILIIANKQYDNVRYLDGREVNGIVDRAMKSGSAPKSVRSDQLCFITSPPTSGFKSITSTDSNSFSGDAHNTSHARVWYGHVIQYDAEDNIASDLGGTTLSPDIYATNWILGRQALMFDQQVVSGDIFADYDNSWRDTYPSDFQPFYMARSDILNTGYSNSTSNDPTTYPAVSATGNEILTILDNYASISDRNSYRDYLLNRYFIFTNNRLVTRPIQKLNRLGTKYISQQHPYFVNNVSDFIVEFAGDYYDGIAGGTDSPDGEIDVDSSGRIYWYGLNRTVSVPSSLFSTDPQPYRDTTGSYALADEIYIFRHDDNGASPNWPQLIRIRYRLHDPKGELMGLDETGAFTEPGKWFEVIVKVPN